MRWGGRLAAASSLRGAASAARSGGGRSSNNRALRARKNSKGAILWHISRLPGCGSVLIHSRRGARGISLSPESRSPASRASTRSLIRSRASRARWKRLAKPAMKRGVSVPMRSPPPLFGAIPASPLSKGGRIHAVKTPGYYLASGSGITPGKAPRAPRAARQHGAIYLPANIARQASRSAAWSTIGIG